MDVINVFVLEVCYSDLINFYCFFFFIVCYGVEEYLW